MSARVPALRVLTAGLLSFALTLGGFAGSLAATAQADSAPVDPANPATPVTATADALPTVQINGVVWSQVVVGNTVYAAGQFSRARPAGAAPGTQETVRNNFLAYDIRTGALITSFAPSLNAQARVLTASPDGSRIYVGGDFTQADGQARYRIAAYDTATGALVPNFAPAFTARVSGIAASNSTVYVGGGFPAVGSVARNKLAAVRAVDGSLLPWAPQPGVGSTDGNVLPGAPEQNSRTSNDVEALVLTNNGTQVVAGGHFDTLNGVRATGVGALDPITGATRPFAIGQQLTNQGVNSGVLSLATDGSTVYGTTFDFYGPGNVEGAFAATADGGATKWVADCHGDTYSSYPMNGALYVSGHPHACDNIGGYPEQDPRTHRYATAYSLEPAGVVGPESLRGGFPAGESAPALLPWFPDMEAGTYTGQYQAGWSVTGNSQYVVYGGEFPRVNGTAQQGLVRYALPSIAPNKVGPAWSADLTPTLTALEPGTVRVTWRATSDQDNENLTYRVYRDSTSVPPVAEVTQASTWWNRPTMTFVDVGVAPGNHLYRVVASDAFGNTASNELASVTVAEGSTPARIYADTVRADGAGDYWPLGESAGSTAYSYAGAADMTINSGVTRAQQGAISGDSNTSFRFDGTTSGYLATKTPVAAPQTFTVEAWFSSTSTAGGKIIGFGDRNTGTSNAYDRHVYLLGNGKLSFGVYPGEMRIVTSGATYNDGNWHHVVASLGSTGMALYVDGQLVGQRTDTTTAHAYTGYWRIGGDVGWPMGGTAFLNGRIDEVAVYPTVLTAGQVANHYSAGTTGKTINVPPTAAFTAATADLTATLDASGSSDSDGTLTGYAWDFGDGATGEGVTPTHVYTGPGTYGVTLTVTDDAGATSASTRSVTVTAPSPNTPPTAGFSTTVADLTAAFDGTGSGDSDGTLTSFAWDFGDGTTGTGATTSHSYAAAGTYDVRLTVTDDDGATAAVVERVTVSTPPPAPTVLASDSFSRTVANGFGAAEVGGPWTAFVGNAAMSVAGGAGHMTVTSGGGSANGYLDGAFATDSAAQVSVSLDKAPSGGGTWAYVASRWSGNNYYRAVIRFVPGGAVEVGVSRVVSGAETTIRSAAVPGLTYAPGTVLQVRFDVSGTGTTALKVKAWAQGSAEPADWQVSTTDTTSVLQAAGRAGVSAYVSGTADVLPMRVDVDDFWVGPAGAAPGTAAPATNAAPTAAFTATTSDLTAAFDGGSSTDSDGTVTSYAWQFGDGATGSGATASHPYAAAGTYEVTLTVTDDGGRTAQVTQPVTVTTAPMPPAANAAPSAAFVSSTSDLTVSVDGASSTDGDGTVTSYAWDFGDGGSAEGATASHAYGTPGTYTVVLTVTDDDGATDTESRAVTVTAPGPVAPAVAADAFDRTVASGWGSADTGGAWTTFTGNATMTVSGGAGHMEVAGAGGSAAGYLGSTSVADSAMQIDVSLDQAPTGGGTWVYLTSRWTGSTYYRAVVRFVPDGSVALGFSRVVGGVETTIQSINLPELTYAPGTVLRVRFDTSGTEVTSLKAKAWVAGGAEPATWQLTATDSTEVLRGAGQVGIATYVSGTATGLIRVNIDDLWSGASGSAPPAP